MRSEMEIYGIPFSQCFVIETVQAGLSITYRCRPNTKKIVVTVTEVN